MQMAPESDYSSLIGGEVARTEFFSLAPDGGAAGGGTLTEQLTNETTAAPVLTAAPATAPVMTAAPTTAAPVTVSSASPGFFNKLTSSLAEAQGKVPLGGLRNVGRQASLAVGVSPEVAEKVTIWLIPVVVVLAVVGTVYALRRRIFSHHVTA